MHPLPEPLSNGLPAMAGMYYVMLRNMRGESVEFGMMFKGFEKFVPLMVIGHSAGDTLI